jgi:hypothetical protein
MPKYVIERSVPQIGHLSARELRDLSAKSCRVLRELGPEIQWMHSYVADDKLYCLYLAPNADLIREHALRGCFPADSVREVTAIIDPGTAD